MATKAEHQKRVEIEREKAITPEELKKGLREVGRTGGEAVAKTHGREFYEGIGRKGGKKGGTERARVMHEAAGHRNKKEKKKGAA